MNCAPKIEPQATKTLCTMKFKMFSPQRLKFRQWDINWPDTEWSTKTFLFLWHSWHMLINWYKALNPHWGNKILVKQSTVWNSGCACRLNVPGEIICSRVLTVSVKYKAHIYYLNAFSQTVTNFHIYSLKASILPPTPECGIHCLNQKYHDYKLTIILRLCSIKDQK